MVKRILRRILAWYVNPISEQLYMELENMKINLSEELTSLKQEFEWLQKHKDDEAIRLKNHIENELISLKNHIEHESASTNARIEENKNIAVDLKQSLSGLHGHVEHESAATNARMDANQTTINQLHENIKETQILFNTAAEDAALIRKKITRLDELEFNLFSEKSENIYGTDSYAQSGEDRILSFIVKSMVGPMNEVTYLDLGANHAKSGSNTYLFYKHGARGVLVEANPALIPELRFYRNGDIILNHCVSANDEEMIPFYVLGDSMLTGNGLSTANYDAAQAALKQNPGMSITTVNVRTTTINDLISFYFGHSPCIVSIDIEGLEMDILRSLDFNQYRPIVFILETIPYSNPYQISNRNTEIIDFMRKFDYIEYAFTGINSVFVDKIWLQSKDRIKKEMCD